MVQESINHIALESVVVHVEIFNCEIDACGILTIKVTMSIWVFHFYVLVKLEIDLLNINVSGHYCNWTSSLRQ